MGLPYPVKVYLSKSSAGGKQGRNYTNWQGQHIQVHAHTQKDVECCPPAYGEISMSLGSPLDVTDKVIQRPDIIISPRSTRVIAIMRC